MKVLLTGATGTIGGAIFRHLLNNPDITSIVTLTRRPFQTQDPRVSNIIVNDFHNWDMRLLTSIADADAMVWAMGTSDANKDTNYTYIVAFQNAFRQVLSPSRKRRFRYVLVSGALVEPDQNKTLWLMPAARKLKGTTEEWTLEFAQRHRDFWQTWIIKPGGISTAQSYAIAHMAARLFLPMIKDDQVGAFVADLVVHGEEPEGRIFNDRMLARGSGLLRL